MYAQEEPSQFSDLIGLDAIKKAENQILSEEDRQSEKQPEEKSETENEIEDRGFTSFFGLYGGRGLDTQPREENTSPSRSALGFGSKPMSFKQNFEKDFQFEVSEAEVIDEARSRVKRSRLDDLQAAASAQRQFIDPAIIAQMFQRQLLIAEDAGLPVHDAVPLPAQPAQPVHHHPMPEHHLEPMHHHVPQHHHMPHHHSGHHISISTKDHHVSHGTATQGKNTQN